MKVSIACCGCGRMLGPNGTLIGMKGDAFRGVYSDLAAKYSKRETADEAAEKAGWSIADDEGANHRCPECRNSKVRRSPDQDFTGVIRRGMYVER